MLADLYPWMVAAIGGFLGAALLLPTKLGEAVIQFRVGKTLETFKAQQAHELEQLKEHLGHVGDRGKRSNEMEFQAIETVWRAFVKAWLSTNTCIGQMIRFPDFAFMSESELQSFAEGSGLNAREQLSLIAASDRQKEYISIRSWQSVNEAGLDVYHARLTLREQRIFMPVMLTTEFSDAIERMSSAQVQRRLGLENPQIRDYQYGTVQTEWLSDCTRVFEELAVSANRRLFRSEEVQTPK